MTAAYRLPRPPLALGAAWLLIMIAVPILQWTGFGRWLPAVISISVVAQAAAVVAVLRLAWSWRTIAVALLVVAVLTLLTEAVGTATGFPFGPYTYTDRLQPQALHVPLLIPLAWFMMLPACWAVAFRLRARPVAFAAVSAAALTAWDLLLDPQMVHWDLWRWTQPSGYFGIPWSNFAGWWLTGFGVTLAVWRVLGGGSAESHPFNRLPVRWLLAVYSVTWFLEAFGLTLFWGLPGPGIVGGVVMGLFMGLGWRSVSAER